MDSGLISMVVAQGADRGHVSWRQTEETDMFPMVPQISLQNLMICQFTLYVLFFGFPNLDRSHVKFVSSLARWS